jgi:hypothetical protein
MNILQFLDADLGSVFVGGQVAVGQKYPRNSFLLVAQVGGQPSNQDHHVAEIKDLFL